MYRHYPSIASSCLTTLRAIQNTVETLFNLVLASGDTAWNSVATTCHICTAALNSATDWNSFLTGYNDDALVCLFIFLSKGNTNVFVKQWVVLALFKLADFENIMNGGANAGSFINAAKQVYDIVSAQWDDTCGGGGKRIVRYRYPCVSS